MTYKPINRQIANVTSALKRAGYPEIIFSSEEGLAPENFGAVLVRDRMTTYSSIDYNSFSAFVLNESWATVQAELVAKHGYQDASPADKSCVILRRAAAPSSATPGG